MTHHPASMYEIWKLYLENYSRYCVRTKVLTKFSCDIDLWTPKCIGIFLSPSCICKKSVCWKLLKVLCQSQSVYKVQLWPWPFDPKMFDLLIPKCTSILSPSCIYVWSMKAVHWKLLKFSCQNQVLTKFRCDLDLWTPKCICIFLSPSCIDLWNMKAIHWKLKSSCKNQSVDKVLLWPWLLDPKMYSYVPLVILHLCMKYESCTLKTSQVIMSEPKCWWIDGRTNPIPIGHPPSGRALMKIYVSARNLTSDPWCSSRTP